MSLPVEIIRDYNQCIEESALIADSEADRLDMLAILMRSQTPDGELWRLNEHEAAARAARHIASRIRNGKVPE